MTKTSTQTTPGAERAASPRRGAPEAILEQCLGNGQAGTEHGGKEGPQAGVEVQFTERQCVPAVWNDSQAVQGPWNEKSGLFTPDYSMSIGGRRSVEMKRPEPRPPEVDPAPGLFWR
jgi:hypothetical protein